MTSLANIFNPDNFSLTKVNQILPQVINVLLIIACSYSLSQITWSLIPGDITQSAPDSNSAISKASKPLAQNYRHISEAHLFGRFEQSQTALNIATTEAPETKLNLVLKGVLAATPMKLGSAIISMGKQGSEDTYGIGDKISSATLMEVYPDKVILERAGRLETLRMPKDDSPNLITKSTSSKLYSRNRARTPGGKLAKIRKDILKNPTSFGKYAIPVPYRENGRLIGYRLQPQGDRSLFDSLGFDAKDVIIAVNGVELSNPSKALKALRKLQRAKSIDLTVLRDGAEFPLHFDMP